MSSYKTITIMGDGVRKEAAANGTIYPGYLIYKSSSTQFSAHGTAGGNAQKMFAVEDDLQGNEIDTAYASASRMLGCIFRAGDEVQALLAEGENVSIGDYLESSGDGYLRKHDATNLYESAGAPTNAEILYTNGLVGIALEDLDLSQSSGIEGAEALSKCRIHIEIL
jgi:hypothetical protein